jgi:hypothetical protein
MGTNPQPFDDRCLGRNRVHIARRRAREVPPAAIESVEALYEYAKKHSLNAALCLKLPRPAHWTNRIVALLGKAAMQSDGKFFKQCWARLAAIICGKCKGQPNMQSQAEAVIDLLLSSDKLTRLSQSDDEQNRILFANEDLWKVLDWRIIDLYRMQHPKVEVPGSQDTAERFVHPNQKEDRTYAWKIETRDPALNEHAQLPIAERIREELGNVPMTCLEDAIRVAEMQAAEYTWAETAKALGGTAEACRKRWTREYLPALIRAAKRSEGKGNGHGILRLNEMGRYNPARLRGPALEAWR